MTETDLDIQTDADLEDQETEATLPWESIDPDETPVPYASPFASTALIAVEAEKRGTPPSPFLLNEFSVLENEAASAISDEEREEQLADRAFFSDRKISIEMLNSTPPMEPAGTSPADASSMMFAQMDDRRIADPFRICAQGSGGAGILACSTADKNACSTGTILQTSEEPAREAISMSDCSEAPVEKNAPQAGPLNEAPELQDDLPALADEPLATEPAPVNDGTSWETTDEIPAEPVHPTEEDVASTPQAHDPLATDEHVIFVSRALPADAVHEATITFSTSDSLLAAASELATLAESFTAEGIDEPADRTIFVSLSAGGDVTGLADISPQPAAEIQVAVEAEVDLEPELDAPVATTGGGWTIPLMCLGIGLIACCMVIPQGESNRRLRYEQAALAADLQQVQKQVSVNDEFLKKVSDDPTLAERLAGRQMKTIRKGQKIVDLKQPTDDGDMSPFSLVDVARPADLPAYKPKTGTIANLCNNARSRLYLLGSALGMVAVGLVMGFGDGKFQIATSKSQTNE